MSKVDIVPETVEQALEKWDRDEPVFTVEMGGIGPGYEQCIQILVFELLRDATSGAIPMPSVGQRLREWGEATVGRLDPELRFSGAQVGAAKSLASSMLIHGYRAAVRSVSDDRHIQVQKHFPEVKARDGEQHGNRRRA